MRGTKKAVEELETKFETGKKPTENDFFDWLASFYHKDEDIAFLINIAKATLTEVQAGEDNTKFMTALRTYQSILWWVRLGKLPLLQQDVQVLIQTNIDAMWAELLATDDGDNVIDTLGEVFQVLKNFNEREGGIQADFVELFNRLNGFSGLNSVMNMFNAHDARIDATELVLYQVPGNLRQVQNTFDSLQSQVTTAQNSANTAQAAAEYGQALANAAQSSANTAQSSANAAQTSANNAQSSANAAQTSANNAQGSANWAIAKIGGSGGETVWDRITGVWGGLMATNGVVSTLYDMHDTQQGQIGYLYYTTDQHNITLNNHSADIGSLIARVNILESYH